VSRIMRGSRVELSSTCWRRDWREERKVSSCSSLLTVDVASAVSVEEVVGEEDDVN